VVLDEPTAGVDPVGSRDIRDLILKLKSRGITVLLSSHLLGQVQEICDRVGILANGTLVREGPLRELLRKTNQTQLIFQDASPQFLAELETHATRSGARIIERGQPLSSLEQLFLEATEPQSAPPNE
jgi:ABC-2 type transport system ATP-binding protein